MKTNIASHPSLRLCRITAHPLLLSLLFAGAANGATILSDDFTGATTVGAGNAAYTQSATNWYSLGSTAGSSPVLLTAGGSPAPISGNFLRFGGTSANGVAIGGFAPVTLDKPLEYIEVTVNYRYSTPPTAGPNNRAMLGLYYDNGTPMTANEFGTQTQTSGDKGCKVQKLAGDGTSDLKLTADSDAAVPVFFSGNTQLDTPVSTGVSPNADTNLVYTETLRITLAANGTDLLVDGTFGVVGGGTFNASQSTIAGGSVLSYTFNEVMFSPTTGGGGVTLMDNVLVTNVVPEPSTATRKPAAPASR
jgi:hypothetical protein